MLHVGGSLGEGYYERSMFNQAVDELPVSLEELSIRSASFNQSLDSLPQTLGYLGSESHSFNQSHGRLPHSIEEVTILCDVFNMPWPDHLPSGVVGICSPCIYKDG